MREQIAPIAVSLPKEQQVILEGWAMVQRAPCMVWQPTSVEEIGAVLDVARQRGRTVAPRGAGYSYTDAALNEGGIVLDLSHMCHVLAWDATQGIITVEPGVTIRMLWQTVVADGWWPPVVPGTMGPTIGGCLGMNIHGKNAWRMGSIGEHVLAFDLLSPQGTITTVTRQSDAELFHAAIGGLGMLGIITSITLQMQRIVSGKLATRTFVTDNLAEMFARFAEHTPDADYLVGWIDGFATGAALGRGLVERADFETTPDPQSLHTTSQDMPPTIAGIVPRSQMWRVMKLMLNDRGMRLANAANMRRGKGSNAALHRVPHAQFHFFHDYLPNAKRAWLPGGLRQFQTFIPHNHALAVCTELLTRSHQAHLFPYLCVLKQHRADPFLLRYQTDGFSLSLDFHVTAHHAQRITALFADLQVPVLAAGGTFFSAKDDTLDAATYARTVGSERITRFLALKQQHDPEGLLQSDLFRRLFGCTTTTS